MLLAQPSIARNSMAEVASPRFCMSPKDFPRRLQGLSVALCFFSPKIKELEFLIF